ncbi:hypothetical protein [Acinetobacter sp. YH12049]|uniref:hypothetical protein n=1 Tax=Acinetobacter sp. YH12049 TaxID=2601054 RepID=UPI0015D21148|nr:hypothetical protein [Acinetobacter sp. YH12049]
MKHIDKNKDIADYTLIQENIVLKLDTKAKELLGYFFDALNYIYSEVKKSSNIQNINFYLLSLKPKIDCIIGTKNKEVVYQLLNTAIGQWFKEDIGSAYLKIDKPSKVLKNNKISLPLPHCSNVDFISPDIYKKHLDSYYDPYIYILKIKNIFIAQINFYRVPIRKKKFYVLKNKEAIQVAGNYELINSSKLKKKAYADLASHEDSKKMNYSHNLSKMEQGSVITLANKGSDESINYEAWKQYFERFKSTNNIDIEIASEILEAFKEIDSNRNESNRKYLQEYYEKGKLGKFGLPQAKWRHGTYGISSKEPDFFSKIKD